MKEGKRCRAGLVFAGVTAFPNAVIELLSATQVRATFIVAPDILVQEANAWREAVAAGHELGNGALVGVTLDGRVENWPPTALEAELEEVDRLLRGLGQNPVRVGYLPGSEHISAAGDYEGFFLARYESCLSDAAEAVAVGGRSFPIVGIDSVQPETKTFVLLIQGEPGDLESLHNFLSDNEAMTLSSLAKAKLGSE